MVNQDCVRAESLGGAIALGEATDAERETYRKHVATCSACLQAFGGEREIERVMAAFAQARASETWEPVPRRRPVARFAPVMRFAATAAAVAIIILPRIGAVEHMTPQPAPAIYHVALEKPFVMPVPAATPHPIAVVHNVITQHGATTTETTQTTEIAEAPPAAVPEATAPASNVPIWRREEAMPVARAPVTPAPIFSGRAESMSVAQPEAVREVMPLGGDAAIKPRPPRIAYDENAQGTTAFEVLVDDRGAPTKCTITKPSGYLVLDSSVCKAAMAARYAPRLINGKATSGVYRDAFTFRASDEEELIPRTF
jgi:TonB family protein